jgi:hypothetical protein
MRIVSHHVSTVLHYHFKIPTYKTQKGYMGKDVGPTRGFVASPEVGPGATIGTLRIGYPRVQALSQDKRQGNSGVAVCPCGSRAHFPAQGSSWGAACPRGSDSRLLARSSSGTATCPRGSGSCLPAQGSSGATTCCLGSSTRLLAQGSSRAAICPMDGLYKMQAVKQIFPGDPTIMIFIGARAHVSAKALRDKGCSTRLHGMQQVVH